MSSKTELLIQCELLGITKCKSKNKGQLMELIKQKTLDVLIGAPIDAPIGAPIGAPIDVPIGAHVKGLTFIDLFCGIGGFHQAMLRLNGTCVFACDIDEKCRGVYQHNYGICPSSDISKVIASDIPDFDVLCAGFPCQAFSNSGKKQGFSDVRGNLFEHILKIASVKRPSFMFLENVKHIKKIDNGNVYRHILKRINETGYTITEETVFELSPHQLGIPQQRERVIFVCIRVDLFDASKIIRITPAPVPICFDSILETETATLEKYRVSIEIESVLNAWNEMVQNVEVDEVLSPTIMCNEFHSQYSPEEFKELPVWKQDYMTKNKPIYLKYRTQWDEWYDRHKDLLSRREIYGKLEWQVGKVKPDESIFNHFIQFRQSGIRVKRAVYFPTLVAIVQTPIYAKEKRYITPRECARLQSFPDSFVLHASDHVAYKQLGNAVNLHVVHYVIRETLAVYRGVIL